MKVRQVESLDWPRLRQLFEAQGFDYELPSRDEFVAGHAIDDNGIPMAILARPTVELYMLADPNWKTPQWRFEALRKLHESLRLELRAKGFRDVHVWLPPQKEKSFGRRLMRSFGWNQPLWKCFSRSTEARVS